MLDTKYKFGEVHDLAAQVEAATDRVHVQHIFNTANGGVALLAFKAGQKLDEHVAPANLMVNVLEGEIEFTVVDTPHTLKAGEFMLVGENVRHSVAAKADSKVLLVKVKS
ncbi:MAG: cupin domain-containing protein [Muribaculaceae bacterium]|nr:cupin domain-containing protein [Muribaculaceae bacterium]